LAAAQSVCATLAVVGGIAESRVPRAFKVPASSFNVIHQQ